MERDTLYRSHSMQIARNIKTITATKDNVRKRADELVRLMNSTLRQSFNIMIFADKVVSLSTCASSNHTLYAYGHVIVMVTSQIPVAMEVLIDSLNKECIFTVPKFIHYSKDEFESRDAYLRAIGYQEEDGKLESIDSYLARLTQLVKLYGALIQTEADGFTNLHGIEEGWKWLFRFSYDLPVNVYTAVALEAFIEMAGFALYKRYKNEFKILLNIISHNFLKVLKEKEDARTRKVVVCIENYIQSNQFLKEPEGWQLRDSLLSNEFNSDESNHQYQHQNLSGLNQGYRKLESNLFHKESNPFHKEPKRWWMQENSLLSQGLNPNVSNHQQRDSCKSLNRSTSGLCHAQEIARLIRTIAGTKENTRKRADDMVKLMNSPYPQFVYTKIFADNIVSKSTNAVSNSVLYGYGHVIVMVTSKIPLAMKDLLSKLNEECIFTVPKYFGYSEVVFGSKDAYLRAIGYQEQDGKLESMDTYLERLARHMKLYGALIQTEVEGIQNLHGIEEGWKWLARFLNDLPANIYTVVALAAFIEVAGFALYKRYTNQFKKLLKIISRDFLEELKETDDPKVIKVAMTLDNYIQSSQFLKEPEGRQLLDYSISKKCNPIESLHQQHYNLTEEHNYISSNKLVFTR